MNNHNLQLLPILYICLVSILLQCNGGTSETGNAHVTTITGSITDNGKPVSKVLVQLVADDYMPSADTQSYVHQTTTDQSGNYMFDSISWGSYYINATSTDGRRLLSGPFDFQMPEETVEPDSLQSTSHISIPVKDSNGIEYVYIKGTTESVKVQDKYAIFDAAPAGNLTVIGLKHDTLSTSPTTTFQIVKEITVHSQPFDTVTVHFFNTAPIITTTVQELSRSIYRGTTSYFDSITVIDADDDPLHFSFITSPTAMEIDSVTGIVTWSLPDTLPLATYRVGVKVTDTENASDSIEWDLTVVDVQSLHVSLYGDSAGTTDDSILFYSDTLSDTLIFTNDHRFIFFWGNGDSSGLLMTPFAFYQWSDPGTYQVRMSVRSGTDASFNILSDTIQITITSALVEGPQLEAHALFLNPHTSIDTNLVMLFQPVWAVMHYSLCSDDRNVWYDIDWGDGTLNTSIQDTIVRHTYITPGTYHLSAVARCNDTIDAPLRWTVFDTITAGPDTLFDTIPPVLTLIADTVVTHRVGEFFIEPGYYAWDDIDLDLTADVVRTCESIKDSIFMQAGTITITYSVTDSHGYTVSKQREVIVEE